MCNANRPVYGSAKQPIPKVLAKVLARIGPLKHPLVSVSILNYHEVGYVNTRFLHALKIKESWFSALLLLVLFLRRRRRPRHSLFCSFFFSSMKNRCVLGLSYVRRESRKSGFPALVFSLMSLRKIHHLTTLLTFRHPTRHSHTLMVLETFRTLKHAVALSAYNPRTVLDWDNMNIWLCKSSVSVL